MSARIKAYHSTIAAAVAIAHILLTAVPATAHEVTRDKGFYLGAKLVGSSLHVDDDGDQIFTVKNDGGGLLLVAGYSFNAVFSLEMELGGVAHETSAPTIDAGLGSLQLFLHYRFRPAHAFRPYVKGGIGGYGLRFEEDGGANARIEGGGIPLGGGFDYFFSNHFSLGVDLTHHIINYDTITFDLGDGATVGFDMDERGAMTTLGLALTGYF